MSEQAALSIAIVGMAGRFPGARNVAEFWENLCRGKQGVTRFSDAELAQAGVRAEVRRDPSYVPAAGVIEDAEFFDGAFFGLSARQAEETDPQHRLFLECAWEALEAAGFDPARATGPIGVFAGAAYPGYLVHHLLAGVAADGASRLAELGTIIGNDKDHLTTRVAYKLGLRGPAITVQTACSTSLVAVSLACQSLLSYQCNAALAGGVSLLFPRGQGYLYQPGHILSPDGCCRPFDADSAGTVPGEGVGVVVLKRLEDAIADGDHIHATILSSAVNNDGAAKVGYTAPGVDGQVEVIAAAHAIADVDPSSIAYIEAHGTGTALGDSIEIEALTQALLRGGPRAFGCYLGSAKASVGHLNTAAGITALIKAALTIEHACVPALAHFRSVHPGLDLARAGLVVPAELTRWPEAARPRRAGVSSFGFGGTNAHCILEEAPPRPAAEVSPWHLLPLSARTPAALDAGALRLSRHLEAHPHVNLADVALTLQLGRSALPYRRALVCRDLPDALVALQNADCVESVPDARAAMLFTGQGGQQSGMAALLYDDDRVFRDAVDRCCAALPPGISSEVRKVLLTESADNDIVLRRTNLTQPALFVFEYALAQRFLSWGLAPIALLGHSLGEWVAATVAGVFQLEDALSLVVARGELMQSAPEGAMLAVSLGAKEAASHLTGSLALAAVNGKSACVISGAPHEVSLLEMRLQAEGLTAVRLQVDRAFHGQSMDALVEPFAARVARVPRTAPSIPFLSNETGTWIKPEEAVDPHYWGRQLRATVRFAEGMQALGKVAQIALEVGPGHTLTALALRESAGMQAVSCSLAGAARPDRAGLLAALGRMWTLGVTVDWSLVDNEMPRFKTPLPTYAFERQRHWVEAPVQSEAAASIAFGEAHRTAVRACRNVWIIGKNEPARSLADVLARRGAEVHSNCDDEDALAWDIRENGGEAPLLIDVRGLEDLAASVAGVTRLLQAFGRVRPMRPLSLCVVAAETFTRDLRRFASGEAALLYALCSTASVEYADLRVRLVDVDVTTEESPLVDEVLQEGAFAVVVRGERRLQRPLEGRGHRELPPWPLENITARDTAIRRSFRPKTMDDFPEARRDLDALCASIVCAFFEQAGVRTGGSVLRREELRALTGTQPRFHRLLDAWVDILTDSGMARREGEVVTFDAATPSEPWGQALPRLRQKHPQFAGTLDFLERCATHQAEALRGDFDAISALYPDGSASFVQACERSTVDVRGEQVCIALACETACRLSRTLGRPLRVLEIGGGRGLLTWPLASALRNTESEVHFTDLGRVFVDDAKREAERRGLGDRVTFGVLDASRPPEDQGYADRRFDLIVAFNVVHATPDVGACLGHLRSLLEDDGAVMIVEALRVHRWDLLTWGLAEGFWHYDDRYRTDFPLMGLGGWSRALKDAGFEWVESAPEDEARFEHGLVLGCVRKPESPTARALPPLECTPIQQLDAGSSWSERMMTNPFGSSAAPQYGAVLVLAASLRHATIVVEEATAERPRIAVQAARGRFQGRERTGYVAPRSPTEKGVCALCEDLLGVSPIGLHDNLVALGADSLIMLRLTDRARRELGLVVPAGAAFRGLTPAALAAGLGAPDQAPGPVAAESLPSALVALQPEGELAPWFFVHPAAGVVFPYVELARGLGTQRPFYALQASGLDGTAPPDTTIEAMALRYVDAIRRVRPHGPYLLGGFSFGCLVAYEMACLLSEQGEQIAVLALLDEPAPVDGHRPAGLNLAWQLGSGVVRSIWPHLHDYLYLRDALPDDVQTGVAARWKRFLAGSVMAKYVPAEHRPLALRQPAVVPMAELFQLHVRLTGTYKARAYRQRITLLKATRLGGNNAADPTWGWRMLAASGVEVHTVPGEHLTMLRRPCVDGLVATLADCVARAEQGRAANGAVGT